MKNLNSGYLYIVLCTLLFSLVEVLLKTVEGVFAPLQITFLRFFIGGVFLLPFAIRSVRQRGTRLNHRDLTFFLGVGFVLIPVSMSLYQLAIVYTTASAVAIIISSVPIFVTFLAYFILHEQIHKNHVVALVLELLAILIIIDPIHNAIDPKGAMIAIVAAVLFAAYTVLGKKRTDSCGGIGVTCFSFLCGSMELLIILLLGHIPAVSSFFSSVGLATYADVPIFNNIPLSALPSLAVIGIVSTGLGFVFQMLAIEKTSAQEASLIFFIKPALASFFAYICLNEEITSKRIIGILFFMIGAAFSVLPPLIKELKAKKAKVN